MNKHHHRESRKEIVAFLLTCNDLKLEKTNPQGERLVFEFSPKAKVEQYVDSYYLGNANPVQPKTLLEKFSWVNKKIWEMRNKRGSELNGETYDRKLYR